MGLWSKMAVNGLIWTSGTSTAVTTAEIVKTLKKQNTEKIASDKKTESNSNKNLVYDGAIEKSIIELKTVLKDLEETTKNESKKITEIHSKRRENKNFIRSISKLYFLDWAKRNENGRHVCIASFINKHKSNLESKIKFNGNRLSRAFITARGCKNSKGKNLKIFFVKKDNIWKINISGEGKIKN